MCSLSACFADGILPADMEASELLSDTFEVLSSKEIKLLAMRSKADRDLIMEEDEMALANVVMQEAQKKLISQVSALLSNEAWHTCASPSTPAYCWTASDPSSMLTGGPHSHRV